MAFEPDRNYHEPSTCSIKNPQKTLDFPGGGAVSDFCYQPDSGGLGSLYTQPQHRPRTERSDRNCVEWARESGQFADPRARVFDGATKREIDAVLAVNPVALRPGHYHCTRPAIRW